METQQNLEASKSKLNVGYFFLSLGVLVSLITSVTAFLNLAFEILNQKFPDILNGAYQYGYNSYQFDSARNFLAMLIIMFPAFLILAYFWKKKERAGLSDHDQTIRKWLSYIVIFLSILIAVIDLIVLVRYFVSGEITVRFILKVLIAIAAAKTVLYYFLPEVWSFKLQKLFRTVAIYFGIVMVLALIIWSFVVMGSPFKQRELQLDDRRVQDLQSIQYQVINYWQQKEQLPADLKTLTNPISNYSLPVDPEYNLGKVYEYNIKDKNKLTFELCATFSQPMPKGVVEYGKGGGVYPMVVRDVTTSNASEPAMYPYPSGTNDSWDHGSGRTCFERTIDKDLYPPYPKVLKN